MYVLDELLCKVKTILRQVGDDDWRASGSICTEQLHDADGSSSRDENWLTKSELCFGRCMQTYAQRLQERNLGVGHGVGDLVKPASWMNMISSQRAVLWWHAVEVDGGAQIVL